MAAFNYYGNPYGNYPVGYQSPMLQQQIQPTPQIQPMQTQQMQGQPNIIWISNEYEAERYPVAPNAAITLWSTSEPVVYLKQADATGKPTLKTYDLVERVQSVSKSSASADDKNVIYAKKDDLEAVIGVIKGISGDIEQMKGDLYGMAGRKKTISKKPKEDEEADE